MYTRLLITLHHDLFNLFPGHLRPSWLNLQRAARVWASSIGGLMAGLLLTQLTLAQTPSLLIRAGGDSDTSDGGLATATDAAGNIYVTGSFHDTANFNTPSNPASNTITSAGTSDMFVAKYNASGALQWLRRGGGSNDDSGNGIAVGNGGVYVTGFFTGTANFNTPSNPASNTLTSVSSVNSDIFVAKYDESGTLQWLRRGGGSGINGNRGNGIAVDNGGVYVTGEFEFTVNFNTPSNPVSNTLTSPGGSDIFVVKYDESGTLQWLRRGGAFNSHDHSYGIAVDNGGVYVTGFFGGTADFNTPSDPTSNTLTSAGGSDLFVAKYNESGTLQWLRRGGVGGTEVGYSNGLGGAGNGDVGNGIAVDNGGVYVTGFFGGTGGTADFNTPSDPASNTLTSVGGPDIFVAKYDELGTLQWLRRGGATNNYDFGFGIAVGNGGVYVTGAFNGTADFNTPSNSASNTLTSASSAGSDLFVAKYNESGTLQWLRRGGGRAVGFGIALGSGGVYVTGNFRGTANFNTPSDPTSNTLTSAGFSDIFLVRYSESALPVRLTYFNGRATPQGHQLAWQTAQETGNAGFTLLRGATPTSLEAIANIPSLDPTGTTNSLLDYSYLDTSPPVGLSYYQLRQTDFDGSQHLSAIIALRTKENQVVLYPNPAPISGLITLEPPQAYDRYELMDASGKVMQVVEQAGNLSQLRLPVSLAAGSYLLRLYSSQKQPQVYRIVR